MFCQRREPPSVRLRKKCACFGTNDLPPHKQSATLTLDGPCAREADDGPNPFTDYRLTVTFRHESGSPQYAVPGYFAADGDAANSSGDAGRKWRAHLSPDKAGRWSYRVSFVQGKHAALNPSIAGKPLARYDGKTGTFEIAATDKTGRDFRGEGRLQYVGKHHLRFADRMLQ